MQPTFVPRFVVLSPFILPFRPIEGYLESLAFEISVFTSLDLDVPPPFC